MVICNVCDFHTASLGIYLCIKLVTSLNSSIAILGAYGSNSCYFKVTNDQAGRK